MRTTKDNGLDRQDQPVYPSCHETIYAATIPTLAADGTWGLRIPFCPFCKAEHWHGFRPNISLGHRAAHCENKVGVRNWYSYELILIGGV